MLYKVERNPIIIISEFFHIQTIGDPHLGREFKSNVFSHRRGERELSVWNTFKTLLKPKSKEVKVVSLVGDLFDTFSVKSEILLEAFESIQQAALENPDVDYVLIPGNHDLSKDTTKASTYSVLHKLISLSQISNLYSILEEHEIIEYDEVTLLCCAYNPFENTELTTPYISKLEKVNTPIITIGHFDGFDIDGKGYTPTVKMKELSDLIVSGHEHTYKQLITKDVPILFTGSMQPYSHAEDPLSEIYITIDCDLLEDFDVSLLKNKFVRILRDSDFELKESFECISLTYKLKEEISEIESITEDDITIIKSSITYTEKVLLAANEIETKENIKKKYLNYISSREYLK